MNTFILIIVALNVTYNNPGSGSQFAVSAPQVTMQQFGSEKACVFAREVVLRRAGDMAGRLNIVCIPKD